MTWRGRRFVIAKLTPTMRVSASIAVFLGALLLTSCHRTTSVTPSAQEPSVEERVTRLEQRLNSNTPAVNEAEARKQFERDLAEIQVMGLVERARSDFGSRVTNAAVETWTIGYLRDTNMVWCDVRYRLPSGSEILQQEFGYSRKGGTNWNLMWREQPK